MKAVIMAGGEGSRLRPLTCGLPKPLVPVLNQPMMTYIVELLKRHNITDIAVTLQYLPELIKDYYGNGYEYGVSLNYFTEDSPLGTAGSVKNAEGFLDDTFIVISGDALTDFDLTEAVEFHRRKKALATLVLTRVKNPLEYGVVITSRDGRITQFLEKPSWGEVFSDTVNTGIYILEPEILNYVKEGQKFDFSKDLFPLLLKAGKPLYGMVAEGYWCDIGNLEQYLQSHEDVLTGRVKLQIPGIEIRDGIYAGKDVEIENNAEIKGPVFIGKGCKIRAGARISQYSVIGDNCIIGSDSSVKKSVLWNGAYVGNKAALRGAIIGSSAQVYSGVSIYEGVVVGSRSLIKENCIINPDIKIWPHKEVEAGVNVQNSLIWGTRLPKKIFGSDGVTGLANLEITPEHSMRLGAAFASVVNGSKNLLISSDSTPAAQMIKGAVISGLQITGASVFDLGDSITPVHRFAVREMGLDGGIHVKSSSRNNGQLTLLFVNNKGGNIPRSMERKVESMYMREDFKIADYSKIKKIEVFQDIDSRYISKLVKTASGFGLKEKRVRLVIAHHRDSMGKYLSPVFEKLGIIFTDINLDNNTNVLSETAKQVVKNKADAGAVFDSNGETLILVDEKGNIISDDLLTALSALVLLKHRGGRVVVPFTASEAIEEMAGKYKAEVIRTKTAVQDFIEGILAEENGLDNEGISQFMIHSDALAALLSIIGFIVQKGLTLAQLVSEIPLFYMNKKTCYVPWEEKGKVIRNIVENPGSQDYKLLDGVKVYHPEGWALVLPDPEEPVCRVFSEGASMEIAESLTDFYVEKIKRILNA